MIPFHIKLITKEPATLRRFDGERMHRNKKRTTLNMTDYSYQTNYFFIFISGPSGRTKCFFFLFIGERWDT